VQQCLRKAGSPAGVFPHVSNLRVTFDSRLPIMSRLIGATIQGVRLDPAQTYKVVIPKYIHGGGDGITAFREAKMIEHAAGSKDTASIVMAALRVKFAEPESSQGVVAEVDGRMRDLALIEG
jgi:2',3'-cyclic-nucleotide 2'-phosphodiesterase (5'-nucleotidase family)